MTTDATYYFARLNIVSYTPNLFSSEYNKGDLLTNALTNASPIDNRSFRWGFFDVSTLIFENASYLTGTMVKFKPDDIKHVVDEESHTINTEESRNEVTAQVQFYLHVPSGLLVYSASPPEISREVFRSRFLDLFHTSISDLAKAEISTIDDQHHVVNEFQSFSVVTKISIDLVPSNPRFTEMWKDVDSKMKDLGLSKLKEEYVVKSGDDGKRLTDSAEIKAKIAMAEDGYGHATVRGEKGGKSIRISTQDAPVFARVWEGDLDPLGILNKLSEKVNSVLGRFV